MPEFDDLGMGLVLLDGMTIYHKPLNSDTVSPLKLGCTVTAFP